jgi:hypothetical protein
MAAGQHSRRYCCSDLYLTAVDEHFCAVTEFHGSDVAAV